MKKVILILIFILVSISDLFPQSSGWTKLNSGTTKNLNAVHSLFGDIFVVGDSGTILHSSDLGESWSTIQSPTNVNLNDVRIQGVNSILAVGNGGLIILSTDQGNTWQFINSGVTEDLVAVDVCDGAGIIGGKFGTVLWCFLHWGTQWEIKQTGLVGSELTSVYMYTEAHGFVGGKNSISQALLGESTNRGNSWIFNSFYLNESEGKISDIDFIWRSDDIGFATSVLWDGRGAISKSSDEGTTWITTIFDLPINAIAIPWTDSLLKGYAVGYSGTILKTYNLGESWNQQQSGTGAKLNDIQVYLWYKDTVFVVGDEGTILRSFSGGEPVNSIEVENELPRKFTLEQNFPNPFNPSTKIKFTVPVSLSEVEGSLVTLKVYDVLGNEVATLVNEEKTAGEYEVTFASTGLASGVYIYQLFVNELITSKKMVLIK